MNNPTYAELVTSVDRLLAERDAARIERDARALEATNAEAARDAALADAKRLRKAGRDALMSLFAAHSLLQTAHKCGKQPRMVVASTRMLEQMLKDYEESIQRARAAFAKEPGDGK